MDLVLNVLFLFVGEGSKGVGLSTLVSLPPQPSMVEAEVIPTSVAATEGEVEGTVLLDFMIYS